MKTQLNEIGQHFVTLFITGIAMKMLNFLVFLLQKVIILEQNKQ